jgi:hypothetical protein
VKLGKRPATKGISVAASSVSNGFRRARATENTDDDRERDVVFDEARLDVGRALSLPHDVGAGSNDAFGDGRNERRL